MTPKRVGGHGQNGAGPGQGQRHTDGKADQARGRASVQDMAQSDDEDADPKPVPDAGEGYRFIGAARRSPAARGLVRQSRLDEDHNEAPVYTPKTPERPVRHVRNLNSAQARTPPSKSRLHWKYIPTPPTSPPPSNACVVRTYTTEPPQGKADSKAPVDHRQGSTKQPTQSDARVPGENHGSSRGLDSRPSGRCNPVPQYRAEVLQSPAFRSPLRNLSDVPPVVKDTVSAPAPAELDPSSSGEALLMKVKALREERRRKQKSRTKAAPKFWILKLKAYLKHERRRVSRNAFEAEPGEREVVSNPIADALQGHSPASPAPGSGGSNDVGTLDFNVSASDGSDGVLPPPCGAVGKDETAAALPDGAGGAPFGLGAYDDRWLYERTDKFFSESGKTLRIKGLYHNVRVRTQQIRAR